MEEQTDINKLFRTAMELLQTKQFTNAESLFRQILSINPNQYDALRFLGVSAGRQGDILKAVDWLIKAVQIRPESARAHHDLGLALAKLGQFEEALNSLHLALRLKPEFPEAYLNIGNVNSRLGCQIEAASFFETALSQHPGMAEAQAGLERVKSENQNLKRLVDEILVSILGSDTVEHNLNFTDLRLPRRELLSHFLNELNLTGLGVEIGVQEGHFSAVLLRNWKGQKLYSIDPWREFSIENYADVANLPQATQDDNYKTTIRRLMPYQNRSVIWRLTSREASELIPNGSLDFCYLDGDHSLRGVQEDIQLWEPKVKSGGILAGHDYIPDGTYPFGAFGVKSAVDEFVASRKLRLFRTNESDTDFHSWLVFQR